MKIIISLFLWAIGLLFFFLCFPVLVFCFFFLSKKTIFSTARFLFGILIRIMGIKLEVRGEENIQKEKPYIIMGNHQSLFDVLIIPTAIPLVFTAIEASYHFSIPIWGYLIKKWGVIPIERTNLKKAMESLETARKTLESGMDIAILPEGHRTKDGKMSPFKKGPFHMAKGTDADILPFGMSGVFKFNPKGSLILNPGIVTVNIGKPIENAKIKEMSVEELRGKVFESIKDLALETK